VKKASLAIISPWFLQRHKRIWTAPDEFRPERWQDASQVAACRNAFIPFSAGPRVCIGASLAMAEGVLAISGIVSSFKIELLREPVPVAHLTLRSKDGIALRFSPRLSGDTKPEHRTG
ncbi:MAG TPA: cytochrome P450, partial [Paracoccaceae bacterium]|nr:cytochrome P450 [Paracoccaceae bacterium]